jgi:hypothetical protein
MAELAQGFNEENVSTETAAGPGTSRRIRPLRRAGPLD